MVCVYVNDFVVGTVVGGTERRRSLSVYYSHVAEQRCVGRFDACTHTATHDWRLDNWR